MTEVDTFIAGLPKAELHLHLEGSLEPELMFELARRNKVEIPYKSVEEVRAAYAFSNLQDFLDIYYQGAEVLQSEDDFFDLTRAYMRRVSHDNAKHVEVFFDPQTHTDRGVPFRVVTEGIIKALDLAHSELGVTSKLILCFLRHLAEEAAIETLKTAEPYLDRVIAVGLDSSEMGHPPSKFKRVFEMARERGLKCVAHAGEEGPPSYVWEALDLLSVDRIDHGNRALEDEALVKRLVSDGITLTVCPLSNLKLRVVDTMVRHPLRKMLSNGLAATVNSDDPAYFGGYLNDNYHAVAQALALTQDEIVQLARNSFSGSFLSDEEIARHHAEIDAYGAGFSK